MADYDAIRPWCELIVREQLPMTVAGQWRGLSLLFPMEKLFERYLADCLRRKLLTTAIVVTQAAREHLCRHRANEWFELLPDLLVTHGSESWILHTKSKRLNQDRDTTRDKYGISQEDMYQMLAYGQRYLNGAGDLFLIYPKTREFSRTLPVFQFSNDLRLWAVAFDLELGTVVEDGVPEHLKGVVGLTPWSDTIH